MKIDLIDAIGLLGSTLFVIAFVYANRAEVLDKRWFNALNLAGALLLLWSLWHRFNLAAFVLEVVWAGIALVGLIAALKSPSRLRGTAGVPQDQRSGVGLSGAAATGPPPPPPPSGRGEE